MCGICGIAYVNGPEREAPERVAAMTRTIAHRGPDASATVIRGKVALGHSRLSIIDLAHGHQPMTNEDGTIWIVYNGEIYNHADFRSELVAKGHTYRTRCDTEAIIHLYEEHGEHCVERLHGMFAFALWDERHQKLILARDRTGIKPLYYAESQRGDLVFGSEIKALFASGRFLPSLNEEVVIEYFATGHVSGRETLLSGIRKLEPGSVLTWEPNRLPRTRRYWRPGDTVPGADISPPPKNLAEAKNAFWNQFSGAVANQLMSDVPLGVFLSGGLDSTLIAVAALEAGKSDLQSFSVGYKEAASELPFARSAAKALGLRHHEVIVDGGEFFDEFPRLTNFQDLPLTFSASIPLYFVARLAREHVKVVLTGEGSDELFAGYGRYPRALWNFRMACALDSTLPVSIRKLCGDLVQKAEGQLGSRLSRSFLARSGTFEETYLEAFSLFNADQRRALVARHSTALPYGDLPTLLDAELASGNPLEALLRYDQMTYLQELLLKQDSMSMATSLESRVPFLHDPLVAWAANLPARLKLSGLTGKYVVRQAAKERLPADLANSPKRGFLIPLSDWLKGVGRDFLRAHLPSADDALLSNSYTQGIFDAHIEGRANNAARLWRLLAFQVWRQHTLASLRDLGQSTKLLAVS